MSLSFSLFSRDDSCMLFTYSQPASQPASRKELARLYEITVTKQNLARKLLHRVFL
jgi:hypothetical protein